MSRFRLGICLVLLALSVLFLLPKSATAANLCSSQTDSNGNKTYDCDSYCSSTFPNTTTSSDFCNTPAYLNSDCSTYPIIPLISKANMTPAQCCKNLLNKPTALCSAPRNNPPCSNNSCSVSYPQCGVYACSDPLLISTLNCSFGVSFTCYLPTASANGCVSFEEQCNADGTAWVPLPVNACTAPASCTPPRAACIVPVCASSLGAGRCTTADTNCSSFGSYEYGGSGTSFCADAGNPQCCVPVAACKSALGVGTCTAGNVACSTLGNYDQGGYGTSYCPDANTPQCCVPSTECKSALGAGQCTASSVACSSLGNYVADEAKYGSPYCSSSDAHQCCVPGYHVTIEGKNVDTNGAVLTANIGQQIIITGPTFDTDSSNGSWYFGNILGGKYAVTATAPTGYAVSYAYSGKNISPPPFFF